MVAMVVMMEAQHEQLTDGIGGTEGRVSPVPIFTHWSLIHLIQLD